MIYPSSERGDQRESKKSGVCYAVECWYNRCSYDYIQCARNIGCVHPAGGAAAKFVINKFQYQHSRSWTNKKLENFSSLLWYPIHITYILNEKVLVYESITLFDALRVGDWNSAQSASTRLEQAVMGHHSAISLFGGSIGFMHEPGFTIRIIRTVRLKIWPKGPKLTQTLRCLH